MGKQRQQQNIQVQEQQVNVQANKKPLNQYLPHDKYINLKTKIYRKRLSQAIKGVKLNKFQIKKAVDSLVKFAHEHQNPADLIGKQEYIYLELDMSRIPEEHSVRPIQIQLPYSLYSTDAKSRYTIITSDENQQTFTETMDTLQVPMLREVLSYNKIKKNYKQNKDKRQLISANDLLFCDWKIYNLLRQPLGKLFYDQKKFPFPIECQGKVPSHLAQKYQNYEQYVNGLAGYTYTMLGNGPVYTIKIGKTKMTSQQLVKNIMHGAYGLIANILDKKIQPTHVRQIKIKTYNSPSLPIYCHLTEEQIKQYKNQNKVNSQPKNKKN